MTNQMTLDPTHAGADRDPRPEARTRVLVAIASYGRGNDRYLAQLGDEYRTMSFDVEIVVLSNIDKNLGPDVETRVGLPSKNPWSLPFAHRKLFAERAETYGLFVYAEDDILITEAHLRAFLEVTADLGDDELAGILRIDKAGWRRELSRRPLELPLGATVAQVPWRTSPRQVHQRACGLLCAHAGATREGDRLWRLPGHELPSCEVMALIPDSVRTILSIGCVALDAVVSALAAERGVEMIHGDFRSAPACLEGRQFDCMLYLNVLHLVPDPVGVLRCLAMSCPPARRSSSKAPTCAASRRSGIAFAAEGSGNRADTSTPARIPMSAGKIRGWCEDAGFVRRNGEYPHRRAGILRHVPSSRIGMSMAMDVIIVARKAGVGARPVERRSVA